MKKFLALIYSRSETIFLTALVLSWSFVWDYNHSGDFSREGRLKLVLLTAALFAAWRFAKTWHWTVGVFYAYLAGNYLHFDFSPWVLPVGDKAFVFTAQGHEAFAAITALLFLIPILARAVSRRSFEYLTIGAASLQSMVGILNLRGIYPFLRLTVHVDENLPIGFLGQQTILGPFLAYGFTLASIRTIESRGRGSRAAFAALAILNFAVAILTKSSMTYGSLVVSVLVLALFYRGLVDTVIAAACSAGALIFARYHYDENVFWHSGRLEPWRDALSLIALRPWFGFGLGSWAPISEIIKEVRGYQFPWTYLHCDPLQALLELGRVGMGSIASVGLVVALRIRKAFKNIERADLTWICALAVFGTDSLANFVLHLVPHGPIFALAIYQLIRPDREEELRLLPRE